MFQCLRRLTHMDVFLKCIQLVADITLTYQYRRWSIINVDVKSGNIFVQSIFCPSSMTTYRGAHFFQTSSALGSHYLSRSAMYWFNNVLQTLLSWGLGYKITWFAGRRQKWRMKGSQWVLKIVIACLGIRLHEIPAVIQLISCHNQSKCNLLKYVKSGLRSLWTVVSLPVYPRMSACVRVTGD